MEKLPLRKLFNIFQDEGYNTVMFYIYVINETNNFCRLKS